MNFDLARADTVGGQISDQEALEEVAKGNREMFEVIVRRYNQRLFRVGMAYLRNHELTEDAMQNAYLNAYMHLGSFNGLAAFSTWITRIMINECLTILRKQKSIHEKTFSEDLRASLPAHHDDHGQKNLSLKEMKALLEKTIGELPEKYRTLYMLRDVQQLSTAETAESLGLSVSNVKVGLHRARELLKTRLLKSTAGIEIFPYPAIYCNPLLAKVMKSISELSQHR